uniref:cAMP-dependent protein kinase type II regulatory subunit n=1 Tax=Lygus hesperus TaxID=30085 RepID=A0A0A9YG54_LYGHE
MSLKIPDSFRELLLEFAICFYKKMPEDILSFSINYFKLLKDRKDVKAGTAKAQVVLTDQDVVVIHTKSPSPRDSVDDDDEEDDEDEPPPVPADYRRKSVYTKGYNPDDEPDDEEESEFGKFPKNEEMKKKLEATIKDNLLFRGLEPEQMTTIIDAMKEVPVRVGDEIIKQGDDGDYFYVIDSGVFEVFVKKDDGTDLLIRTYNNGGSFGELALMYNQPRSATVKAKTNGIVFSLDRNAFQKIVVKSAHERRKLHEELLSKVSLFQGSNDVERQNIADVLSTMVYSNGERIIKEGDDADGMYFVVTGSVRVTRTDGSDENVIKIINQGEYFGELALLNKKPRAANCFAIGTTKLAFLSAEAFERLMGPCLNVMQRHAAQYSKRLSEVIKADNKNLL